ncbi:MAG: hypothetical protein AABX93_01545 [Nanoarchaeota archaeon]
MDDTKNSKSLIDRLGFCVEQLGRKISGRDNVAKLVFVQASNPGEMVVRRYNKYNEEVGNRYYVKTLPRDFQYSIENQPRYPVGIFSSNRKENNIDILSDHD